MYNVELKRRHPRFLTPFVFVSWRRWAEGDWQARINSLTHNYGAKCWLACRKCALTLLQFLRDMAATLALVISGRHFRVCVGYGLVCRPIWLPAWQPCSGHKKQLSWPVWVEIIRPVIFLLWFSPQPAPQNANILLSLSHSPWHGYCSGA